MRLTLLAALLSMPTLAACSDLVPATNTPEVVARWDHRPEAEGWNTAMMSSLMRDGAAMVASVPGDVSVFCPGYAAARPEARAAFYVAFFSALARYESGWNPRAAGGGGRYQGLMQISPATARHHDCTLPANGLYDGGANLGCAVRIANVAVLRDGVLAEGRGGLAADWPPMRDAGHRREVAAFTRALPQCQG